MSRSSSITTCHNMKQGLINIHRDLALIKNEISINVIKMEHERSRYQNCNNTGTETGIRYAYLNYHTKAIRCKINLFDAHQFLSMNPSYISIWKITHWIKMQGGKDTLFIFLYRLNNMKMLEHQYHNQEYRNWGQLYFF